MSALALPATVRRGIAYLDELRPGWAQEVNRATLDMGSGCDCILGQVFGDYDEALHDLHLSDAEAARLGFYKWGRQTFEDLTRWWLRALRDH